MKKIPALLVATLTVLCINAQKKTDSMLLKKSPNMQLKVNQKPVQQPTTTTPISSSSSEKTTQTKAETPAATAPALTDNDYFLSAVKISLKTGKDNKEYPSSLSISISPGNVTNYYNVGNSCFRLSNYKNELKINSSTDLYIPQTNQYYPYIAADNTLAKYKQNGLTLQMVYLANLLFDAWKIDGISLTLQFKDAHGNPHPTMGNKTITFTDANLWMDGYDKVVTLYRTDGSFNPMPAWQGSVATYKNTYK